jgi:hypothetical protein
MGDDEGADHGEADHEHQNNAEVALSEEREQRLTQARHNDQASQATIFLRPVSMEPIPAGLPPVPLCETMALRNARRIPQMDYICPVF